VSVCIHCGMPTEPEAVACSDCPEAPAGGAPPDLGQSPCELLSAFIDGDLDPDTHAAFRVHAASCQPRRANGEDYLALGARAKEVLSRCAR